MKHEAQMSCNSDLDTSFNNIHEDTKKPIFYASLACQEQIMYSTVAKLCIHVHVVHNKSNLNLQFTVGERNLPFGKFVA